MLTTKKRLKSGFALAYLILLGDYFFLTKGSGTLSTPKCLQKNHIMNMCNTIPHPCTIQFRPLGLYVEGHVIWALIHFILEFYILFWLQNSGKAESSDTKYSRIGLTVVCEIVHNIFVIFVKKHIISGKFSRIRNLNHHYCGQL